MNLRKSDTCTCLYPRIHHHYKPLFDSWDSVISGITNEQVYLGSTCLSCRKIWKEKSMNYPCVEHNYLSNVPCPKCKEEKQMNNPEIYYPKAVFTWEDRGTLTITYPQVVSGLVQEAKRPVSVGFLNNHPIDEIPSVSLGISISNWIQDCHTVLYKVTNTPLQQPTAKTEELGTFVEQIPFEGMEAMGKIFAEGSIKYGADNWKTNPTKDYRKERCRHAIRHLMLWANGDRQEAHLAKVAWFCFTELWCQKHCGDII